MAGPGRMRTYESAVSALNSLQSGFERLEERRRLQLKIPRTAVAEMTEWARRIGYHPKDFNSLNIVHVAGTKGKGTTCAFVNSILNEYRLSEGRPNRIGLYTSPHLIAVRERIRINSEPISEHLFTRYFFEVWDALEASASKEGLDPAQKPVYFRYLTLLSFHVFKSEGVDAAIYEVGVGGELDSTNLIDSPLATGITTLGIDHTQSLGDTIEQIAWHKAGIFKPGCPALSVTQVPEAAEVVQRRAIERGAPFTFLPANGDIGRVQLRPNEEFQKINASMAIALAKAYLQNQYPKLMDSSETIPERFRQGLKKTVWRGRCETISRRNQTWYVDGAHSFGSLEVAGKWFRGVSEPRRLPRILIFNQQSTRNAVELLKTLQQSLSRESPFHFDHVIFCTNITYKDRGYKSDFDNRNKDVQVLKGLSDQREFAKVWRSLDRDANISVLVSIEEAILEVDRISTLSGQVQILAVGSLHLIGGIISLLEN